MELCEIETDAVNTARAQFMRIYNEAADREREREEVRATLKALPSNRAMELVKRLAAGKEMEPKKLRAAE